MSPIEKKRRIKQALANSTEFHTKDQRYVPELDLSRLEHGEVMNKSWFFGQIVFQLKDEVVPEQSDLPF